MFSQHLVLEGKDGVKRVDEWGPYAVIVNRRLHDRGKAGKYAVVNARDHWVDSVHPNRTAAASQARRLFQS